MSMTPPEMLPTDVGVNSTPTVQLAPTARVKGVEEPLSVCRQVESASSYVKLAETLGLYPDAGSGNVSASLPMLATVAVSTPSVLSVAVASVAVGKFRVGAVALLISVTVRLPE